MKSTAPGKSPAGLRPVLLAAALVGCGCSSASFAEPDVASINSAAPSAGPTAPRAQESDSGARGGRAPAPSSTVGATQTAAEPRPSEWAQPVARPGLPNLHQVTPELFRGAQPSAAGLNQLQTLGVRTIINLRAAHSDRPLLGALPLGYEHISMKPWHAEDEDIVEFLKLAIDPQNQPVFVHCQYGADRTGLAVAVYRVAVQGWAKAAAIREMTRGGFGYHAIWKNLVDYLRQLDIPRIRREAGID